MPLPHPEVFAALAPGVQLLIDDGKIRLEVEAAGDETATARVLVGGTLSDRKGVSVVGAVLPVSALTEKDRGDLAFAVPLGVDWVALSFVQRPEDLDEVRALAAGPVYLVAKLEKPAAVERLDEIVARSDAVMVARGDLGVEMAPEKVPTIQRQIIRACRAAGKPVIVATQMLESMIEAPTPTRAEASDVATAVYEGADAVMLSAESAAGKYPVEAVRMMDSIIAEVEADPHYRKATDAAHPEPEATISDVICHVAAAGGVDPAGQGDRDLHHVGQDHAARRARAAGRTDPVPDAGPRDRAAAWRWSGVPTRCRRPRPSTLAEIVEQAAVAAAANGLRRPGELIAIAAGMPFGVAGTTNLLRIARLPGVPA